MKKSSGIIFAILGGICAALALFFYSQVNSSYQLVMPLTGAALACCLLFIILIKAPGKALLSLLICASAVLLFAAFGFSLVTEVEVLGYLISGLRTWADVQNWAYFSVASLLGWLILVIGSFTGLGA